jgi:hypothetical protein
MRMAPGGDPAQDAAKHEQAHPEGEAHGATPPHGDPLEPGHRQTGGPHESGAPEPESDSGTPPHGDPLAP